MASDDPVLPPVYSITRMPGRNAPRASAPSIIASAMRSLYDPVGLRASSLTTTSASALPTMRFRRTTGVPPIAFNTESAIDDVYIGVQTILVEFTGHARDHPSV